MPITSVLVPTSHLSWLDGDGDLKKMVLIAPTVLAVLVNSSM